MELFPSHLLVPPRNNELEICVFGPGYGESIVMHIPEIGWGIIDSCIAKVGGKFVVPPLEYLSNILSPPFPKLAFVILTHPHEDHYKGLDQVIKSYPGGIERVCRYDGNGIRELKVYMAQQKIGGRDDPPGLYKVFQAMNAAAKSGEAHFKNLGEMTLLFEMKSVEIEGYGLTDIRMIALSPSAASVQKYIEMLFAANPQVGKAIKPVRDEAHNLISVALLLQIGTLQIILGSDVENGSDNYTGWNGIIYNRDCPDLWANLVKVAHHGSEGGCNLLAWEQHMSKSKPLAIITPFARGKVFLPRKEDIKNLKRLSHKVGLTGSVNIIEDKLHRYYKRNIAKTIEHNLRSLKILELPEKIGFIRVRFSLDGEITECHAENPGNWC